MWGGTGASFGLLVLKPGKHWVEEVPRNYQEMEEVTEAVKCSLGALTI